MWQGRNRTDDGMRGPTVMGKLKSEKVRGKEEARLKTAGVS